MNEREYEVPEGTNLVINDTPIEAELVSRAMNGLRTRLAEFVVLDRQELTNPLTSMIEKNLQANNLPLGIIFPGQGAQRVKEVLPKGLLQDIKNRGPLYDTPTKREYVDNRPQLVNANIPESLVRRIDEGEIAMIWIIDDVVATGQTIQGIRTDIKEQLAEMQPEDPDYNPNQRFSYPQTKIPNIPFVVFTWLRQRLAKTTDFDIFNSIVYSRRSGRVALNSLSTLLNENVESQPIRKAYAVKYFSYASEFFSLLERLKKIL